MATRRFCDRCGAEINPAEGSIYAGMSNFRYEGRLTYELCVSCAHRLEKWLNGDEKMVGEVERDG